MKTISRRDLCLALPASLSIAGLRTSQAPSGVSAETAAEGTLSVSKVLSPDTMPAVTRANGAKSWNILHGVLETGEKIGLHESLQPPGIAPNPPHSIQHSEIIMVQQGTLLFEHDGISDEVGAGGVIFVVPGTMHSARNVGDTPAKYLVIAIGGDTR